MIYKGLYFLYQWVVVFPIMLVITLLTAIITIIGCKLGDGHFWGYWPGRIWSRATCALCLLPVNVIGRENMDPDKSYVFVANHQGAFDIFLIYGYLNKSFKWIMKDSLRKMPFVGDACESAGHIFIDDSGARGVATSILKARRALRDGSSVVIFPEGARTLDGKMKRFKKGAFQLALGMNVSIVPVTIEGPYKVMKRGTKTLSPHRMSLTIHPAIEVDNKREGELERVMSESREVIASALIEK